MISILIWLIGTFLNIFVTVIIVQFILGLLIMFNVVSMHNHFVAALYTSLNAILDPFLRPIRRILPDTGMIDFSPIVLIIGLQLVQRILDMVAQQSYY